MARKVEIISKVYKPKTHKKNLIKNKGFGSGAGDGNRTHLFGLEGRHN